MMTTKKVPAIRFNGFDEEWERKTVSDILIERNEQFPKNETYPLMAFIANIGVAPKGDRYNREFLVNDEQKKKYKRTELGDFIYSSNNLETGSIGLNNYGNASISPVYSIFRPTEIANSNFIGKLLLRKEFINQMVRWRQGVVYGQWKIHEHNFIQIGINIASFTEQTQIGNYFKELDGLILLQEQKLEKVTNLKKAMLEKMFPKEHADVPEIRFKGFTEHWEKKKLGEVVDDLYNGQTPSRMVKHFWNGNINWLSSGELNRGVVTKTIEKITLAGRKSANLRIVPAGTFVLAITGLEAAGTRGNCAILGIDTTMNQSCMAIYPSLPKLNTLFLFQWYRRFSEEIGVKYTQGTKQQSFNVAIIKKLEIVLPNVEEQQKIGEYFQGLDQLISQSQQKIEQLKHLKQALLQKMFI